MQIYTSLNRPKSFISNKISTFYFKNKTILKCLILFCSYFSCTDADSDVTCLVVRHVQIFCKIKFIQVQKYNTSTFKSDRSNTSYKQKLKYASGQMLLLLEPLSFRWFVHFPSCVTLKIFLKRHLKSYVSSPHIFIISYDVRDVAD